MYDEFTERDTVVIAVAQEDKNLASHGRFLDKFSSPPPFDIVADLGREATKRYHRTTSYLIDKKGVVREIFPALIHMRPHWRAVLNRMDELGVGK
jgi:peroxiredoxin